MIDEVIGIDSTSAATRKAEANTLLNPRFYKTDYAALERLNVEPVRAEWDEMMAAFRRDVNKDHFERNAQFDAEVSKLPADLHQEFLDFLISSVTAEFSGCVLYSEIKRKVRNPDMRDLMGFMARDEARHAGFINQALKDFGVGVDLGLSAARQEIYAFSAEIHLLRDLSVGEDRLCALHHDLPASREDIPSTAFTRYFAGSSAGATTNSGTARRSRCLMRAHPHLLRGHNKLWIRFFLLAVFATMYVRDHARPLMHEAFAYGSDGIRFHRVPHHQRDLQAGVSSVAGSGQSEISSPAWSGCAASPVADAAAKAQGRHQSAPEAHRAGRRRDADLRAPLLSAGAAPRVAGTGVHGARVVTAFGASRTAA